MTNDEYATWDAPYVLGALDRTERLRYEAHLVTCPGCRAAVAELAGLPALLGRVDSDVALALVDPVAESLPARLTVADVVGARAPIPEMSPAGGESDRVLAGTAEADGRLTGELSEKEAPADLLPRLAQRAQAQRRRGRWAAVGAAVVAAAAAVAVAIPITATVAQHDAPPAVTQVVADRQLEPVAATPVSASVRILDADGKATVEMSCRYASGGQQYQADLELWVTSRTGNITKLMGWSAGPGDALTMTRTTELPPDQITALEVKASGGSTILRTTI